MIPKILKAMIPPLKRFKVEGGYETRTEAGVGVHNYAGYQGHTHSSVTITKQKPEFRRDSLPYYHVKIDIRSTTPLRPMENPQVHEFAIQELAQRLNKAAQVDWRWQRGLSTGMLYEIWPKNKSGIREIEAAIRATIKWVDSQDVFY